VTHGFGIVGTGVIAAIHADAALRDSGFTGFMSLEPHLAQAGRFGGFSGPQGFRRAAQALKCLLDELAIPYR